MANCQQCQAETELYLCPRCVEELRGMLTGLARGQQLPNGHATPGFIEYLEDAALGRTRLGESARRSTDKTTPLPVHLGASAALDNIHAMLARWIEVINVNAETLAINQEENRGP